MAHNKRCRGGRKAKANYLLSDLIRCGECGFAMYGNKRPSENGKEYISYRCGGRNSKKIYHNKEVRKERIEEFVLAELEKKILCDEMIPKITKELNNNLAQQEKKEIDHKEGLEEKLVEVNKKINNIIEGIMSDIHNQALKDKMNELEEVKVNLEIEIASNKEEQKTEEVQQVTEEQVRAMLSKMEQYVAERNLPQCRQLIQDFVKEVKVYKDHVEVVFNVVFCVGKNKWCYIADTRTDRRKL